MRDEELIRRIQQGEKEWLDPLIDQYYQDVFRFCYYRTGSEQAAYDCAQETFLRMIRFLDGYVETHKFRSYLLRIALNVCRDYYRTGFYQWVPLEEGEDIGERKVSDIKGCLNIGTGGDDGFAQAEDACVIQQCLMRLPEFQREVIILHFYYGYKLREIGAITGVSLPTAKSRLRQGLDKLRRIFMEEGLFEEREMQTRNK